MLKETRKIRLFSKLISKKPSTPYLENTSCMFLMVWTLMTGGLSGLELVFSITFYCLIHGSLTIKFQYKRGQLNL